MKFGHLVEICFWLNLAVKGLKTSWSEYMFYLSVISRQSRIPFNMIVLQGTPKDWLSYQQNGKQKDNQRNPSHFLIL